MRKRWVAGIVVVALLGISGTSLAVHSSWLGGRWAAARAATLAVDVTFASSSRSAAWGRASTAIRSAAAGHALSTTDTSASFRQSGSRATAEVEPLLFSPAVVRSEISAWRALRSTVGDGISLHLGRASGYTDGTGVPTREYTVRTAADMRAVAAAWPATPPAVDPALPTSWSAPGLELHAMPSSPVMAAVSALAEVLPLAPVATSDTAGSDTAGSDTATRDATGTFAVVLGNVRGFQVSIVALRHGAAATARPDDQLVAGTRVALESGAAQVDWVTASGIPSIVAGTCGAATAGGRTVTTTYTTNHADDQFAATLTAAGLDLPAGVRGGVCV